jgi:UDP-N-acetylglucosamine--N-acetylmuramyl-(pentapeptide) pyrophosphoryl-undecaprenol N-acetylglucosamine transferase
MALHAPPKGGTLLVGSTGGHLEELVRLRRRLPDSHGPAEWVTFDDPQARSLLAGERVHYVPYVPPRGYLPAITTLPTAHRILRHRRFDRLVSTGSGIALPFFVAARALNVASHYIESAARTEGPSLTGKLVARIPGVHLYTQYPSWESSRWLFRGSLFDQYERVDKPPVPGRGVRRVVVTLGSMRSYEFPRAVERLAAVLPEILEPDAEVLWQVGPTDTTGLGISSRDLIPASELAGAIARADLVVAHAGIGSALTALEAGKQPVLLPRRQARGEHVDDHQVQIAEDLEQRELAISRDVDELSVDDLRSAAASVIRSTTDIAPFVLDETRGRFGGFAAPRVREMSRSWRAGPSGSVLGGVKGNDS